MHPTDPRWKTAISAKPQWQGPWDPDDHHKLVEEAERLTGEVGRNLDAQWKDVKALLRRLKDADYPNWQDIEEESQKLYWLRNSLMTVLTTVWRKW